MASLTKTPLNADFEDFVAAHLSSRGMFVETGVTERDPRDILELDIVWTDYRKPEAPRNALETKSAGWGFHDYFKFYGWLTYLRLPAGAFIYRQLPDQTPQELMERLAVRTGVKAVHIDDWATFDAKLEGALGLPQITAANTPELWRYSFWAQRLLLRSLSRGIDKKVCPETGKAAKQFIKLINDATFFEPDVRARVSALLKVHIQHPYLAKSAALEIEGKSVEFKAPADSSTFKSALFSGTHFPVQACLYVCHRGRLAVLKAAVDYVLEKRRGVLPKHVITIFGADVDVSDTEVHAAFLKGVEFLEAQATPQQYAVFWQVFLCVWGGFILDDRRDEEYEALSKQTGVPLNEIDAALSLFGILFPLPNG